MVLSTFQFQTVASCLLPGTPDGGNCGRIQSSRLAAVIVVPLMTRSIRPRESTAAAGGRRSPNGTRSGCRVL